MQRVSIARALINDPEIILADEPTGALDSATSIQVMDLLKEISKTRLIIMVTHNSELADRYSVPHGKLELEFTESAFFADVEKMYEVMKSLRKKGFKVAIDDFGSGFSSLNNNARFVNLESLF